MKAIVYTMYGPPEVLSLAEVEKPTPREDEVMVEIYAVSVNGSDWEGLTGKPLYARIGGLRRPKDPILGSDIAGRVESVGSRVERFRPGDEVFGETLSYRNGFAEFARVREKGLAHKPPEMSFEEASAIPQGAVIALQGLRDAGQVQPGQHVLINGAGGAAGTFAVQLAKYYGAEVTAVDNPRKQEFLRTLGADHVIDYTREDYTKNRDRYDLILDVAGYRPAWAVQRALKPGGSYYVVGGSAAVLLQVVLLGPWFRRRSGKQLRVLMVRPNHQDLEFLCELHRAGKIAPVIDRVFSLQETPNALRYVGEGRALGKVVIRIREP
jgi:NADPH:quinone reductase-like Zn-dependent oxidoreductase